MTEAADSTDAQPIGLAEPLRMRLTQVAAEVLGRLPADQVPAALRAIAKFTPAKRQRLGAVAIAATLDTDEQFREAVAQAISQVATAVVTGLREEAELQVSDPLDVAAVAYLTRPPGWQQVVGESIARWSTENGPREAAAGEAARLRTELAEVRGQLKSALARAKAAESAQAVSSSPEYDSDELARLTKTLRVRTGELRAAERERDAARAEVETARADAAAAAAAQEARVRELSARVEEVQRAVEAGRRSARVERELDDARLRMLVDTVIDAAAGIRRELALPASPARPADAVTAESGASSGRAAAQGARGADDAAGLERLLALPRVHLIVDGYNVTKSGYGDLPLAEQRGRLLTRLAPWCARTGIEATVAFDGGARPVVAARAPRGVRVLFSAEDEIADDLIRRLVGAEPQGRPVVVVTSDAEIVSDVRAAGAYTAPSGALLDLLR